jgi:hypothetical protein
LWIFNQRPASSAGCAAQRPPMEMKPSSHSEQLVPSLQSLQFGTQESGRVQKDPPAASQDA